MVSLDVTLQAARHGEGGRASVALEGFLARVRAPVLLQVAGGREALVANVARKRPLAVVEPDGIGKPEV